MMTMGWGIVNMIVWILIIGFAIYGVLSLFIKTSGKNEEPAIEILKERFARGEISEEELVRKSEVLRKK